jgi:hypothetical protein
MANTNSTLITNIIADPPVPNDVAVSGGRVRVMADDFEVAGADFDANDDTIRLCRLPANARVLAIYIKNDDMDSGTESAVNIGLAQTDGTIIDEDQFASVSTQFRAAVIVWTDVTTEALDIANSFDKLQAHSSDSDETTNPEYEIVMYQTATVSSPLAATIAFMVLYTVD